MLSNTLPSFQHDLHEKPGLHEAPANPRTNLSVYLCSIYHLSTFHAEGLSEIKSGKDVKASTTSFVLERQNHTSVVVWSDRSRPMQPRKPSKISNRMRKPPFLYQAPMLHNYGVLQISSSRPQQVERQQMSLDQKRVTPR